MSANRHSPPEWVLAISLTVIVLAAIMVTLLLLADPARAQESQLEGQGAVSVQLQVLSEIDQAASAYGLDASRMRRIAACESRLEPWASSRNGLYVGVYQFSLRTWLWAREAAGFPDAERTDYVASVWVAAWLMRHDGFQHWPACR